MKFKKHDAGKSRLDLVPPKALEIVGFALRHGAKAYSEEGWRKCPNHKKYIAAALRHLYKHLDGKPVDRDTGLLHLAQAATSALFALDLFVRIGEDGSMERKQFSYFGVIERKSKRSGVVVKRFRSYDKAWTFLTDEKFTPETHLIRTVDPKQKVGTSVSI